MSIIYGYDAIAYARRHGRLLHKRADPIEGPREGLTIEAAEEIARIDPSLIWVRM